MSYSCIILITCFCWLPTYVYSFMNSLKMIIPSIRLAFLEIVLIICSSVRSVIHSIYRMHADVRLTVGGIADCLIIPSWIFLWNIKSSKYSFFSLSVIWDWIFSIALKSPIFLIFSLSIKIKCDNNDLFSENK